MPDLTSPHPPKPARPWRWLVVCALVAVACLGVPLGHAASPWLAPPSLRLYDNFLGVGGFIIMSLSGLWSWRRGRAAALTLAALAVVACAVVLRLAIFAEADYDRARLPAAAGGALVLLGAACIAWWLASRPNA
ncbi:MAG: hypothetical protein MUC99_11950 [Anaerolineae bacterium]|jgi:hypothetical protein|nr:hypothetical protein [Anaerolineae bacterium]